MTLVVYSKLELACSSYWAIFSLAYDAFHDRLKYTTYVSVCLNHLTNRLDVSMGFKLRRTNHATSLKPHAGDPDSQRGSSPIVTTGLTSSDALPLSTTSRTLSYARSGLDKQTPLNNITRALDIGGSTFTSYFMQSKNEQYWAMRSMLAETRLSERDRHQVCFVVDVNYILNLSLVYFSKSLIC